MASGENWPTAATKVVGTIGYPVSQSMSPLLHRAAFDALGLDWISVGFPVLPEDTAVALAGARALGICGLSVTMPHKAAAARAVDVLTLLATRLGSVNCVINRDGRLVGDSTDGAGLLETLRRVAGVYPEGKRCLVLGAGGAARASIAALSDAGASEVVVVNRTASNAQTAASLAGGTGRVGELESIAGAEIVVNATPFGMAGHEDVRLEVGRYLHEGQVVCDLVYAPEQTPILTAASAAGAVAVGGIGVLIHQAAISLEHWTGEPAPLDAMWEAARRELARRDGR